MIYLTKTSDYSKRQFGIFRILFGMYLIWHFAALIPYRVELFSDIGILGSEEANPFRGSWPNPLFLEGSHHWITALLITATLASLSFTLGFFRRSISVFLCITDSWLFTANPLITNPSLGYMGMLLLLCAVIPRGEAFSLSKRSENWEMPYFVSFTAWFLLAAGYSFSGIIKLSSPSWKDGSALQHLLENPLARPGFMRDAMLSLPDGFLMTMTWGVLLLEVIFLGLVVFKKTRFLAWSLMLLMHIGIMAIVDFADLSVGMIMVHLFTFQRSWLPARRSVSQRDHLLFVDADCAFCQKSARIMDSVDSQNVIQFSTLQGETAELIRDKPEEISVAVLIENPESKSQLKWQGADAILRSLYLCGGALSLFWILHHLPSSLKNNIYRLVAKYRHRIRIPFTSRQCNLLTPEQQTRYLP